MESETNTTIKVHPNQLDPGANATVVITGTEDNCEKAFFMILRHVSEKIAMRTATTETIMIPSRKLCARVIGRGGSTRRAIENVSGARIKIDEKKGLDALLDPEGPRECKISGSAEQIETAKELIEKAQRGTDIATTETIMIPSQKLCARVIGKGGSTLRAIENVSGARIKIDKKKGIDALLDPEGPRECKISGSVGQIETAKELIEKVQRGTDVAQAAQAAHKIKLMKELVKKGFTFPEDIL